MSRFLILMLFGLTAGLAVPVTSPAQERGRLNDLSPRGDFSPRHDDFSPRGDFFTRHEEDWNDPDDWFNGNDYDFGGEDDFGYGGMFDDDEPAGDDWFFDSYGDDFDYGFGSDNDFGSDRGFGSDRESGFVGNGRHDMYDDDFYEDDGWYDSDYYDGWFD